MTNNLQLITTEAFGEMFCNFYRNMNDDILLTREQIGQALEYSNPDVALSKIHKKHKDRLDEFSVVTKLVSTDGKEYNTILYSERGIMEICRWSRQPKANDFMDWVWDIISTYRHGQLKSQPVINTDDLSEVISSAIANGINSAIKPIYETINTMQQEIQDVKCSQSQTIPTETNPRKKPYNPWFAKMQPKYKLLEEHFNITRGQLYKDILLELENSYGIDTCQVQADYCYENNLNSCYPLEPYEFNPKYRDMIEQIVNSNLIKYGIADEDDPITSTKHITIFNTVVKKI